MEEETIISNIRPSQVQITPLVGDELSWLVYKVFFVYRDQDLTLFSDWSKFKGAVALMMITKNPKFGFSTGILGEFDQYIAFENKDDAMLFKMGT